VYKKVGENTKAGVGLTMGFNVKHILALTCLISGYTGIDKVSRYKHIPDISYFSLPLEGVKTVDFPKTADMKIRCDQQGMAAIKLSLNLIVHSPHLTKQLLPAALNLYPRITHSPNRCKFVRQS
jgi:hypothetical protein